MQQAADQRHQRLARRAVHRVEALGDLAVPVTVERPQVRQDIGQPAAPAPLEALREERAGVVGLRRGVDGCERLAEGVVGEARAREQRLRRAPPLPPRGGPPEEAVGGTLIPSRTQRADRLRPGAGASPWGRWLSTKSDAAVSPGGHSARSFNAVS